MSRYTQDDFDAMVRAISRHADEDMDQSSSFRLSTSYGDVFVQITRALPEGHPIEAYPLYGAGSAS